MAALPYMQLYIADYLADTMHLSTEEHGAYLLLMFNYWQTGKPIPKSRLAKIARMSNDRWISVEESLKEFFNEIGSEWVHARIERDLEIVRASIEQKSAAGRASAAKRKANKSTEEERESNDRSTGVEIPFEHNDNENSTNKDLNKNKDLKDKRSKNIMSGTEQVQHQTNGPVFISLPLTDGKSNFDVTESYLREQMGLYPGVNIEQELRNMRGWLDSNPAKRKTPRGIKRFITTWLQNSQDKPRGWQGSRATGGRDVNTISSPENKIPDGFRG
ncbi:MULTISPECIES: DUF1376 domain-containing protein [Pantoea]|uniref:DUF1376 domain-containing protein n=1 Tax=Candidatus Pantoea gossypiicola TaxID=2608008 RepID=A0AB34CFZ8_9GAMM|nr:MULTISPECIES: DUF1376 domain-containing protein [Pantoea]KAA5927835.1 DUF1376 domain-containing protein [Pantoea sp. VH_8]KAA5932566.1 DUF1376 domain-containing protein [Pantoea sp. VH_4]KAA5984850.1 DUF1376 domain-containing protein [Pantoea sp. M_4]KAA6122211.1 DUF1376 domain-containing protein [Pantoea gossypiicola]